MRTSDNCDEFIGLIEQIIFDNLKVVSQLVDQRRGFENWLQIELLKLQLENRYFLEFRIEEKYPSSPGWCDFFIIEKDGTRRWIEIKMCITNYLRQYTGNKTTKQITQNISNIVSDVNKLRKVKSGDGKYQIVIAYPLPINFSSDEKWKQHIYRLESESRSSINEKFVCPIKLNDFELNLVCYCLKVVSEFSH